MSTSTFAQIPVQNNGSSQELLSLRANSPCLSGMMPSRHICGEIGTEGFAIDWHFETATPNEPKELQPRGGDNEWELCLNLAGSGTLEHLENTLRFGPRAGFVANAGNASPHVRRTTNESHAFLSVRFLAAFLEKQYRQDQSPHSAQMLPNSVLGAPVPLQVGHEQMIAQILRPQCMKGPCQLRCRGIVLQLMADFLFAPCCEGDSVCERPHCLARERVRGVIAILERDLAEPPTLEAIGREIGCSPFHLSRIFSKETGMTIPQYLRTLRMRHAAALLKSGRCNVTEAAFAVGYSSLSHFSHAFCQETGCCPAAYGFRATKELEPCPSATERSRTPKKEIRARKSAPVPAA